MTRKNKHLDESDIALFRQEIGDIEHIPYDKIQPSHKPLNVAIRKRQSTENIKSHHDLSIESEPSLLGNEETLNFRRSGIQRRVMAKLRSGHVTIEAELDLHGMTIPVAQQALNDFVINCKQMQVRHARIIHGKGWSSAHHKPILKTKVNSWLREIDDVLAFCSARVEDGGSGALYVLLRRNKA